MAAISWANLLVGLCLAPLLPGVIARTKALFAGRRGQPLAQLYLDLWKLLRKGAVYSSVTTWVFRAGPVVGLAAAVAALLLLPLGGAPAVVAFDGDLILLVALLGALRFFLVTAALDTGSAFEGMGASREMGFSALAEPVLLVALAAMARGTGETSLSGMFGATIPGEWATQPHAMLLIVSALFVVLLAENSRIPVDDPNTHLELTMIHEVMVLDHGGPDLAFILYAAALKFWLLGALLVGIVVPLREIPPALAAATAVAGMALLAFAVGVVESCMARLRMSRVPQLLVGAGGLATVALMLELVRS
ncbi:MAG: NADH-quinone oxidoreductase subunit H [Planctomycetes bacterium]|nr:NADH-quinone oxidoreductase subunit H [Planctomycetota bacterium]